MAVRLRTISRHHSYAALQSPSRQSKTRITALQERISLFVARTAAQLSPLTRRGNNARASWHSTLRYPYPTTASAVGLSVDHAAWLRTEPRRMLQQTPLRMGFHMMLAALTAVLVNSHVELPQPIALTANTTPRILTIAPPVEQRPEALPLLTTKQSKAQIAFDSDAPAPRNFSYDPGQAVIEPVFLPSHTLQAGESLGALAQQYHVSVETLMWANGLQNGDVIAVGENLRIPRLSGVTYVIEKGDTASDIAEAFNVAPEAFLTFAQNQLQNAQALPVGQEIFIPGGTRLPEKIRRVRGGWDGLASMQAVQAAVVHEDETNMRDGPGRDYPLLVQVHTGRHAQVLGRHDEWLKVDIAGTVGWIRRDLMTISDDVVSAAPEITDIAPPPPVWVWPTRGVVTSGFGSRWGAFHNGLDIANQAWTNIVAARSGTVIEAGWCSGYGYCVKIDHGGGMRTIYGHMVTAPPVKRGEEVAAGDLIGYMGSTFDRAGGGYSTGVHLHFTVLVNGNAIDPLQVLP